MKLFIFYTLLDVMMYNSSLPKFSFKDTEYLAQTL